MTVEFPAGAISGIYVKGLCVNMLSVYVQQHIWWLSTLHELKFNNVIQDHAGIQLSGGGENIGSGFCFDCRLLPVLLQTSKETR